jgi:hypothetical protein
MGWFIDLFFKKKKTQKIKINSKELLNWFNNQIKDNSAELENNIVSIFNKISKEIKRTKENLKILEEAKLRNPNISEREKHFMRGNREAYIKKVELLLTQINIKKQDYNEILNSCLDFNNSVELFGKSTVKSFHILREFFDEEASNIASNVKNLDNNIKELRMIINDSKINDFKIIKEKIIQLSKKREIKRNYYNFLTKKEKELEAQKQLFEKIEQEIRQFKYSEKFKDYNKIITRKEEVLNKINLLKNDLSNHFMPLQKAMKKFEKISFGDIGILKKYKENLIKALINDKELKITNLLRDIKENINELDLKEKKKEKTLKKINQMDKEFFANFLIEYNNLKTVLEEINNKLNKNKVINDYKKMINKKENQLFIISKINKEIEDIKNEIRKIDINNLEEELIGNIKDKMNIEIEIITE